MEAYQTPDFETIKFQLRQLLSQNSDFKDFNWEGSNLSILIDLLSYNAMNQQIYNSAALAESSLDSAIKRANVVAHAKLLGYTPKSKKASRAVIDVDITMPSTYLYNSFGLMRGDTFEATIDGQSFQFKVLEDRVATSENRNFFFENVEIVQGTFFNYSYVADSQPTQRYVIPSKDVDIDTIVVRIQPSNNTLITEEYKRVESFTSLNANSKVYFIQENFMGFYEIFFGDGILGKNLEPQNIVHIEYLTTQGHYANFARSFVHTKIANLLDGRCMTTTKQAAVGGVDRESIQSIKFHAPRSYTTQGRAVTIDDFEEKIVELIPGVESVSVWGGDEDELKRYGVIFISIKTQDDMLYNPAYKKFIIDRLKSTVSTVKAEYEIVDPNFVYISVHTTVRIRTDVPTSHSEIRTSVEDAVEKFTRDNIAKFNRNFYLSSLIADIDDSHKDILSNQTKIMIQKRISWLDDELKNDKLVEFEFGTEVQPNTFLSSMFYLTPRKHQEFSNLKDEEDEFFLVDDGEGKIWLRSNFQQSIQKVIGEIEYSLGKVFIDALYVDEIPVVNSISFNISPKDEDVIVKKNMILLTGKRKEFTGSLIDAGIKVEIV